MIIELSKEFPTLIFLIVQTLCITTYQGPYIYHSHAQAIDNPIGKYFIQKQQMAEITAPNLWCNLTQSEPQGEMPGNPYSTTTTTTTSSSSVAGTASMTSGTVITTTTTL